MIDNACILVLGSMESEYSEAYRAGSDERNCSDYYQQCPLSVFKVSNMQTYDSLYIRVRKESHVFLCFSRSIQLSSLKSQTIGNQQGTMKTRRLLKCQVYVCPKFKCVKDELKRIWNGHVSLFSDYRSLGPITFNLNIS